MVELTIIGRLGADAEIATSKEGRNYLKFNVAVDEAAKGEKSTSWFRCMFWYYGSEPPKVYAYLQKGTPVFIRGREAVSTYTGKDGSVQIDRSVFVQSVQLLPSKSSEDGASSQQARKTDPTSLSTGTLSQSVPNVGVSPQMPKVQSMAESSSAPKVETYDEVMQDLPF